MKHLSHPSVIKHRRPGPKHPIYCIPTYQWMGVVQRMTEKKESLRTIAAAFGVSHETFRRSYVMDSKQRGQQES